MRLPLLLLCLSLWSAPALAQDYEREAAAAAELRTMCAADAGRLWGQQLCGPLLVVDPATRQAWATQPDATGILQPGAAGGGWTGALPPDVAVANTSVDWAGASWIMVLAPLPSSAEERRVLVAHEAWHRVQDRIGLAAQPSDAAHLESQQGRYLLRLEMRALATALLSRSTARRRAALDALSFRAARLAQFPGAASAEAALDRNEGLAAYTGVVLGADRAAELFATRTLESYDRHEAFARAYAYATGPAYGLLLDNYAPGWRATLGVFAPADLLAGALRLRAATSSQVRAAAERYSGPAIAAEERARAESRATLVAELRTRFVDGPRLELPLQRARMEFDPNRVTPLDGVGNFYGQIVLRDAWGELAASEGALISTDFSRVLAAAPLSDGLSGPGWRLSLAPDYAVLGPDGAGIRRVVPAPASPN